MLLRLLSIAALLLFFVAQLASAQIPFDEAVRQLSSADAATRVRAAQMLRETAYPEAAAPLAAAIADADDRVQAEAIAGELSIFVGDKIVQRRNAGGAEAAFARGPLAVGSREVPADVLSAVRKAVRDDNPRIAVDAMYAFGVLAPGAHGDDRRALLRDAAPDLLTLVGASDPAMRTAALRVIGRVFARRGDDPAVDPNVGDMLIRALNDGERTVKRSAMEALGAVRYDRAVDALTQLFQFYEKGEFAEASFDALARIAYPSSAALFTEQLTAKTPALRASAAAGLARLGKRDALPQIEAAIGTDRDDSVQLARAFASATLGAGSVDAVADGVRHSRLRDAALDYLSELVVDKPGEVARIAQDPDAALRTAVADAIALSRAPTASATAQMLARDPDPQVARAGERAVAWGSR